MAKIDFAAKIASRASEECATALDKSYNDMFGLPSQVGSVIKLPIEKLHHYKNDPFHDRSGEEMQQLEASIRDNGLQHPIIVRPMEEKGTYEILAGRRRTNAVKANGGYEIDAIIRYVDDNEAAMIVTETNLRSREKLFFSEKAFAYKLQLDAIKRQGQRTDIVGSTYAQTAHKLSRDIVAEKNEVGKDVIRRYIRLTFLIQPLLDLVDGEKIPFIAGVDLSYLDHAAQTAVHAFFFEADYGVKLDLKLAAAMRSLFKEKGVIDDDDLELLCNNRQAQQSNKPFTMNRKKLLPYLAKLPDDTELEQLFLEFIQARFGHFDSE